MRCRILLLAIKKSALTFEIKTFQKVRTDIKISVATLTFAVKTTKAYSKMPTHFRLLTHCSASDNN